MMEFAKHVASQAAQEKKHMAGRTTNCKQNPEKFHETKWKKTINWIPFIELLWYGEVMCVICIQQVDIHLKKFVNKLFFLGNISFPSSLILVVKEQECLSAQDQTSFNVFSLQKNRFLWQEQVVLAF